MAENWDTAKSGRLVRKAAEILEDRGVATGHLVGLFNSSMCVRGAVSFAYSGNPLITEVGDYYYKPYLRIQGKVRVSKKNPHAPINRTLHDLRTFMYDNGALPHHLLGVENFNDKNPDEVIPWLHKFADYAEPRK